MDVFSGIDSIELIGAALICLVAGLVHGYTGFGAALISVPLLSLIYGPVDAVAISVITGVAGSAQLSWNAVRKAAWRDLWPVITGIAIATPIGVYFLITMDPNIVRRVIGFFVLMATVAIMSGWAYRGPRGFVAGAGAGAVGGAVSGAAGVGGPAVVVYFIAAPMSVPEQRANIVIAIGAIILTLLISLITGDALTTATAVKGVILTAPYVAGTWSGGRLFGIAPDKAYRRAALCLLLAASLAALLS